MRYNVSCPNCGMLQSLPDYALWPDSAYSPDYPEPSEPQGCLDCDSWMRVLIDEGGRTFTVEKCANLAALAESARARIRPGDTMHAMWDVISDAEQWCKGEPTVLSGGRNDVYAKLVKLFEEAKVSAV